MLDTCRIPDDFPPGVERREPILTKVRALEPATMDNLFVTGNMFLIPIGDEHVVATFLRIEPGRRIVFKQRVFGKDSEAGLFSLQGVFLI